MVKTGERDGLDENDFGLNKQQLTNNNIAIKATTNNSCSNYNNN